MHYSPQHALPLNLEVHSVVYANCHYIMFLVMALIKFLVYSVSEFYDPQLVLSAVLKHGPECWFPIGLKLGFTAGQVKAITFAIPRDEDKLTALFETKANAHGRDEAVEQLLDACGTILNPILGV